jgi:protein TonB
MLRAAEQLDYEGLEPSSSAVRTRAGPAASPPTLAPAFPSLPVETSGGRYGDGKRINFPAILITAAFHIVAFAAVVLVGFEVVGKKNEETRLTVVDLTPPPPPPAAATPPPPKPEIIAPIPPVQITHNPPPIATSPDPTPQPPTVTPSTVSAPPVTVPVVAAASPSVIQDGDLAAKMVSGAPPRYPVESRRQREQGTVVLAVTLGTDGYVSSIAVSRSSGSSRLDNAALSAVKKWRWTPVIRDGKPVMVKGLVEIPFVLVT